MKTIIVTDEAAKHIERLRNDEDIMGEKIILCEAFSESVRQLSERESYDAQSLFPLQAINEYYGLINELSKSDDNIHIDIPVNYFYTKSEMTKYIEKWDKKGKRYWFKKCSIVCHEHGDGRKGAFLFNGNIIVEKVVLCKICHNKSIK